MSPIRWIAGAVLVVSSLLHPAFARPASAKADRSVQLVAGIGVHLSTDLQDGPNSQGFFGAGEYVYSFFSFLSSRSYAGLLITSTDEESCEGFDPCELSSRLVFFGHKFRLSAPIPYVSPFLELGFGFSLGTLLTRVSSYTDQDLEGGTIHVPLALGLALGRDHRVDLMFSYLRYPTEDSASGALAVGLSLPLD